MQAFVIEYERGVRVIVHTANLIRIDFDNKTQGVWWQDFPRKVRTGVATVQLTFERFLHRVSQTPAMKEKAKRL